MIGIILILLFIIGFVFGCSIIGAWLWNITLPFIFGLPQVEWWHILALIVLLWIIYPGTSIKIGNG